MNTDKTYLPRPLQQPAYVPQQYVRPAPGRFIARDEITKCVADYAATIAARWRTTPQMAMQSDVKRDEPHQMQMG